MIRKERIELKKKNTIRENVFFINILMRKKIFQQDVSTAFFQIQNNYYYL